MLSEAGATWAIVPQLGDRAGRVAALTGAAIAVAATPFTPVSAPIMLAAAGGLVALAVRDRAAA